nr:MAG TPA: hypothetical protein [Caudoviricetes sp.]
MSKVHHFSRTFFIAYISHYKFKLIYLYLIKI